MDAVRTALPFRAHGREQKQKEEEEKLLEGDIMNSIRDHDMANIAVSEGVSNMFSSGPLVDDDFDIDSVREGEYQEDHTDSVPQQGEILCNPRH